MHTSTAIKDRDLFGTDLAAQFSTIRTRTSHLTDGLSDADCTVQSMEDASPAKWHLGHTTWFFETIILQQYASSYKCYDTQFSYLFNSYYEALGERHPRPARGMLTRPSLGEIYSYRSYVDAAMQDYMTTTDMTKEEYDLILLGLNHEQQHQELLLTDLLHLFAQNPTNPCYKPKNPMGSTKEATLALNWYKFTGGVKEFGHKGAGFSYDCEGPHHQQILQPYSLSSRCITNGEWIEFMKSGGYENPLYWLSDGWATLNIQGWKTPLYWELHDGQWWSMTLNGLQPVDIHAPVCHISYYEADAYARYADKRLPTEYEWEQASLDCNFQNIRNDLDNLQPRPAIDTGLSQMFDDVWEWTSSPFSPYPRFEPAYGAIGEYNGKFMNGQYVLRGGSCVTPEDHVRATYRNFFQPDKRWQFSGLRLADDL